MRGFIFYLKIERRKKMSGSVCILSIQLDPLNQCQRQWYCHHDSEPLLNVDFKFLIPFLSLCVFASLFILYL